MFWERYLFNTNGFRDGINDIIKQIATNGKEYGKAVGESFANTFFGGNSAESVLDPTGSEASKEQYEYNSALQEDAQAFNAEEAKKNRDWQQYMSSTAYRRAFADLEKAGYNPYLALGAGNGAAVTSGATASSSANQVSQRTNYMPQYIAAALNSAKSMTDVLKIIATVALIG